MLSVTCSQAFAGGPLSDQNGDKLAQAGVQLFSVYGGTEYGVYTHVFDTDVSPGAHCSYGKTITDWAWLAFDENRVKMRWDPQDNGSYELQFLVRDALG